MARLRMNCSSLHDHLCTYIHVLNDPTCVCNLGPETPFHYFMVCPLYTAPRNKMRNAVSSHATFNLKTLLHGSEDTSNNNKLIFESVITFIHDTKRF